MTSIKLTNTKKAATGKQNDDFAIRNVTFMKLNQHLYWYCKLRSGHKSQNVWVGVCQSYQEGLKIKQNILAHSSGCKTFEIWAKTKRARKSNVDVKTVLQQVLGKSFLNLMEHHSDLDHWKTLVGEWMSFVTAQFLWRVRLRFLLYSREIERVGLQFHGLIR